MYDEVMKARIYVDASVVGGCEDDEFSEHSVLLMERFVKGEFVLVVSKSDARDSGTAGGVVR